MALPGASLLRMPSQPEGTWSSDGEHPGRSNGAAVDTSAADCAAASQRRSATIGGYEYQVPQAVVLPLHAGAMEAMTARLLISDLDGTLLDRRLTLDPRDVEAAHRAQSVGVPLGIATGRMYRSALPYAQELQTRLPLICYQGALIQELPGGDGPGPVLRRQEVDSEVSLPVLELARQRGWAVNVYQGDQLLVDAITPDVEFYTSIAQIPATVAKDPPLEVRLLEGTTKLTVVVADRAKFPQVMAEVAAVAGEGAEVTSSIVGFCEITAKGVDKGEAVLFLCHHLGLDPGDVVALGDAPNDLPMLRAVGHPVAVQGSAPEVLELAEWVTGGPGDGGLASVVSHYQLDRAEQG
ncbi:MAG: HAD family hydrolase [Candidatus Dormibacteraeota bacterium]|nr:HAD family hydrolase [Candidatus Dormibacteraeota bacterium]